MNKVKKRILLVLLAIPAVILVALLVFFGVYFTRIQTIGSIEQLTDYADGYNLYRMDVKYDYDLDDIIDYGIQDDQTMIDAILKEALPLLPVTIEAPNFGCMVFSLTDTDGDVHIGRNYDLYVVPQQARKIMEELHSLGSKGRMGKAGLYTRAGKRRWPLTHGEKLCTI